MSEELGQKLNKLMERRFDETLSGPYLSPSFHQFTDYGSITKYLLESAQPIHEDYRKKLYVLTGNLVNKFKKEANYSGLNIDIRYQGAIQCETHISLYGEIEILVILKSRPREKASKSVEKLGTVLMHLLSGSSEFQKVDYSNKINIQLTTNSPKANISVLPTVWVNTGAYNQSKLEIDRGIAEYDFANKTRRSYLPFKNIAKINQKDELVDGNLKRLIRLIKSIQVDADEAIDLSDYELAATLYNIHARKLKVEPEYLFSLLPVISLYFEKLVKFNMLKRVISPSRKELVFSHKEKKEIEIQKLKKALDVVIRDLKEELRTNGRQIDSRIPYGY